MASPQKEDGYTAIANELLEAILLAGFGKRQLLIVMAIVRQTYGYNRREDDITGSRLAELTGIRRNHCTDAVAELESMQVVTRNRGRWGQRLSIQKDYEQWQIAVARCPKTGS